MIENRVTFVTFLLGLDFLGTGSTRMPPWERVELGWSGCSRVHSNSASSGEDEIATALAKTVAEITFGCDDAMRQRILDDLVREISKFEAEYASSSGSEMRH